MDREHIDPSSLPSPSHQYPPEFCTGISKSAQKRAAKAVRFGLLKLQRRAREKERKEEKKRAAAEQRAAGDHEGEVGQRKRAKLDDPNAAAAPPKLGARVVVDLGFDELMSDKEIVSLCSQLAYTYSANRRAKFPFVLLYTSLGGRTLARLEGTNDAGHKRWARTEWWYEGYERLWEDGKSARERVVYLTADATEELEELKEDETYIIGGICDHNRYKDLCLNKSRKSDVRAARLPIGHYLASLPTRKVLTVNQVFEILVKWVETRDWEEAFYAVIPKRKFRDKGKGKVVNEISERDGDVLLLDESGLQEDLEGGHDDGVLSTTE